MKIASRAIILHNNKILLVKHKGRDFYSLPGGKVDPNEDIRTALIRELHEELDRTAVLGKMVYVHEFLYPGGDLSLEFFFLIQNGQDFVGKMQGEYAEAELAEVCWKSCEAMTNIMPSFLIDDLMTLSDQSPLQYKSLVEPAFTPPS